MEKRERVGHPPLVMGNRYVIQPGLNSHDGQILPTGILAVTVTSETVNGWTFTTDPSQHYFDGTISFSASDTGNGNVNFSVTANADFTNVFYKYGLGPLIKAGENSTWNNMLNNVQNFCSSGLGAN